MKQYRFLYWLVVIACISFSLINSASAAAKPDQGKKAASKASSKKLPGKQQADKTRSEAQIKAAQEAKALAAKEAEAKARMEAEAKARAEAEAKAKAEAERKARLEAELAAREKPVQDAEALVRNGRPAEAYAILEPLEFERAGDRRFDYVLGIAALDSGKPDRATIAFERVLAVDPNFAGARLDMARAYYQLGDLPRAKTEFQMVMTQNPPQAARITIQKYLDAIQAQEDAKKTHVAGYIEGTGGRDSNINNSTSESQIAVPAFGNLVFTLNPSNLETASYYSGYGAGIEASRLLGSNVMVFAGADARRRNNTKSNTYDYLSLDGKLGVSIAAGAEVFRMGIFGSQYNLDSAHNRDTVGINAEWRHVFSPSNQLNAFVQYSQNRFVETAMKTSDFDQGIVGIGGVHISADGKSAFFGSLYFGRENDVAPISVTNPSGGRADGNKNLRGARVGCQIEAMGNLELFASLGTLRGSYDKENAAFMRVRDDRTDDISAGISWHPLKLWTVRPQVSWSRNKSNIVIYGYDRVDYSVTVRRDFK